MRNENFADAVCIIVKGESFMNNNMKSNEKALLTANDICTYLSIGISTAYKLMNTDGFPTVKIKSRKYANKELLDKWLVEQTERGLKS